MLDKWNNGLKTDNHTKGCPFLMPKNFSKRKIRHRGMCHTCPQNIHRQRICGAGHSIIFTWNESYLPTVYRFAFFEEIQSVFSMGWNAYKPNIPLFLYSIIPIVSEAN